MIIHAAHAEEYHSYVKKSNYTQFLVFFKSFGYCWHLMVRPDYARFVVSVLFVKKIALLVNWQEY